MNTISNVNELLKKLNILSNLSDSEKEKYIKDWTNTINSLEAKKEELKDIEGKKQVAKDELVEVKDKLNIEKEELNTIEGKIQVIKEELIDKRDKLTETNKDLTGKKEELVEVKEELVDTNKDLTGKKEELVEVKDKLIEINKELNDKDIELKEKEVNINDANNTIIELEQKSRLIRDFLDGIGIVGALDEIGNTVNAINNKLDDSTEIDDKIELIATMINGLGDRKQEIIITINDTTYTIQEFECMYSEIKNKFHNSRMNEKMLVGLRQSDAQVIRTLTLYISRIVKNYKTAGMKIDKLKNVDNNDLIFIDNIHRLNGMTSQQANSYKNLAKETDVFDVDDMVYNIVSSKEYSRESIDSCKKALQQHYPDLGYTVKDKFLYELMYKDDGHEIYHILKNEGTIYSSNGEEEINLDGINVNTVKNPKHLEVLNGINNKLESLTEVSLLQSMGVDLDFINIVKRNKPSLSGDRFMYEMINALSFGHAIRGIEQDLNMNNLNSELFNYYKNNSDRVLDYYRIMLNVVDGEGYNNVNLNEVINNYNVDGIGGGDLTILISYVDGFDKVERMSVTVSALRGLTGGRILEHVKQISDMKDEENNKGMSSDEVLNTSKIILFGLTSIRGGI